MMFGLELPAPSPEIAPHSQEFWAATANRRFLVGYCEHCTQWHWPPTRSWCPHCGMAATRREATGRGRIHSWTVIAQETGIYAGLYSEAGPFVVAYVELEEGPTMMTNIVNIRPDQLAIGLPVALVFAPTAGEGDPALPRFEPAGAEPTD